MLWSHLNLASRVLLTSFLFVDFSQDHLILGEDYLTKNCMHMEWDGNKRAMVLQDCRDFAMAYLDDIIIFSRTLEEHLKHIEIIFQKLKAAGLKLKESKCDFFKSEIHYLGHLIFR